MAALKDQWQAQRQQRQQEMAERRQQVRDVLDTFQQERQTKASQLRDDLSLFTLELKEGTQRFLTQTSQQRQVQAAELMQMLRGFTQELQNTTTEFLRLTALARTLMAQQLSQDLGEFHTQLNQSVAALRRSLQERMQAIQAEVLLLQAQTQQMLKVNREQRLQQQMQLMQELANFAEALQVTVQNYLSELELARQERAQNLRSMLQSDRDQRAAEMNAIFADLSQFRLELKQFCADLRATTWGGDRPVVAAPVQPAPRPVALTKPQVKPAPSVQPSLNTIPAPVKPAPVKPAPVKPAAPVVEPSVAIAAPPVSAPVMEPVEPEIAALTESESAASKLLQRDASELEQEIYSYIHDTSGARLNEIESTLGINRFQAVDALRALIKKGWITQRDRIYLIQEEVSL